jgi:alkanesulfonate monooxygenase SsuD/methylene tetrahydromethanopterin reductase-like flavin-dependent oxidoreductase (luciferase family)
MDFGIFNLMGCRDPNKPTAQVFAEVAEQTRRADALGYGIAWFAEHHFSNYSLCASPLMLIAHVAPLTQRIRLGTAVIVAPLYNPARLVAEIATVDALTNGRLMLGVGSGYQPYEFERFGEDLAESAKMTEEMLDIIELGLTRDFFTYEGAHYTLPKTHIAARPVQKKIPIYVAGHSVPLFRLAARHGYKPLSSGRTEALPWLIEQRRDCDEAYKAEGKPVEQAELSLLRFCCITDSREEALRYAENARYQTRLASGLRRREEVMEGTMLVDRPYPNEPPLETLVDNMPIGSVERVAETLIAEIRACKPAHICFNFQCGNEPITAAMRSMELFATEVRPRLERALGPLDRLGLAQAA